MKFKLTSPWDLASFTMFPKHHGSTKPLQQPRRSRVLYLGLPAFLLACYFLFWFRPPHAPLLEGLRGASLAAGAAPADAARLQRMEEGVERLRMQMERLANVLPQLERLAGSGESAAAEGVASRAHVALPPPPPPAPPPPPLPAPPPPPPRVAILGMAKGIDAVGAYRFVRSLRAHMPGAEAVIFTDEESLGKDPLLPWLYKAFDVTLEVFRVDALPSAQRGYHPSSYRWLLMRDYLRRRAAEAAPGAPPPFSDVFFSDVRDTVFQGDLFAALREGPTGGVGFFAFQEQRPGTIAQCGWNSGWVKDCFGEAGLAKVGANVVSCSGTSAASWADAVAYVELMGAYTCPPPPFPHPPAPTRTHSHHHPPPPPRARAAPRLPQQRRWKKSPTVSATASIKASTITLCTLGSSQRVSPRCTYSATRRAPSPPCNRCPLCAATPLGVSSTNRAR